MAETKNGTTSIVPHFFNVYENDQPIDPNTRSLKKTTTHKSLKNPILLLPFILTFYLKNRDADYQFKMNQNGQNITHNPIPSPHI